VEELKESGLQITKADKKLEEATQLVVKLEESEKGLKERLD